MTESTNAGFVPETLEYKMNGALEVKSKMNKSYPYRKHEVNIIVNNSVFRMTSHHVATLLD